jgi:hypothetical protein
MASFRLFSSFLSFFLSFLLSADCSAPQLPESNPAKSLQSLLLLLSIKENFYSLTHNQLLKPFRDSTGTRPCFWIESGDSSVSGSSMPSLLAQFLALKLLILCISLSKSLVIYDIDILPVTLSSASHSRFARGNALEIVFSGLKLPLLLRLMA